MEENNNSDIDNVGAENKRIYYSDAPGTGVWFSIIFLIVTMVAMYILAKLMGNF